MNKTMEYMAFALPVVAFDLPRRWSRAATARVYAPGGDVDALRRRRRRAARRPARRLEIGRRARRRVEDVLAWDRQAPAYVGVYDRLMGRAPIQLELAL